MPTAAAAAAGGVIYSFERETGPGAYNVKVWTLSRSELPETVAHVGGGPVEKR